MNVIASTEIVTTRPCARSTPAMPPAWSMRDSTQPPKMSPLALVSAGMALMRTVSSPRGLSSIMSASPLFRRSYSNDFVVRDALICRPAVRTHPHQPELFHAQRLLGHLLPLDLQSRQARRLCQARPAGDRAVRRTL